MEVAGTQIADRGSCWRLFAATQLAAIKSHPEVGVSMNIQIALQPVIAVIAGLLILMIPRLLNYIVALYLIITGILALVRV
jgi:hypothetical protein